MSVEDCKFINNMFANSTASPIGGISAEVIATEVQPVKISNCYFENTTNPIDYHQVSLLSDKVFFSNNKFSRCNNCVTTLYSDTINFENNYIIGGKIFIDLEYSKIIKVNNCFFDKALPNGAPLLSLFFKNPNLNSGSYVRNCTFYSDEQISGFCGIGSTNNTNLDITNSAFYTQGSIFELPTNNVTPSIKNCTFYPNATIYSSPNMNIVADTSNIYFINDPMFVNPDSGDLRLQPCSPLIDKGDNTFVTSTTDIAGNPRIQRGIVDIGAYEAPPAILTALPVTQPSCPDTAVGRVDFVLQNACAPYQYSWVGPNGSSGTNTNQLSPGDYQFSIIDNRGDTVSTSVTIPVSAPPALTPVTMPVICGGTVGGSATFEASGTGPYSFLWTGGSTDSLRTNLPPGAYEVIVRDGVGCATSGTANITTTGGLSIEIEQESVSCFGGADGALSVAPANGLAPFSYQWANGSTTSDITNVPAGSYAGTLTDAFGCRIVWILPINEPSVLQLATDIVFSSDSMAADGSIALTPSGGTGPYTVLWNTTDALWSLGSLSHGVYTATITDANGCTLDTTFIVGVTNSTNNLLSDPRIQVYPNPVLRDQFSVQVPAELGVYDLIVQDALGRHIWRSEHQLNGESIVPVKNWSRGWYLVTIRTKQGQKSMRLMRM
jgi:hypothetical protein